MIDRENSIKTIVLFLFHGFKVFNVYISTAIFNGSWWHTIIQLYCTLRKSNDSSNFQFQDILMKKLVRLVVHFIVDLELWPLLLNGTNGQNNRPCTYLWSAGQNLLESVSKYVCSRFHVLECFVKDLFKTRVRPCKEQIHAFFIWTSKILLRLVLNSPGKMRLKFS